MANLPVTEIVRLMKATGVASFDATTPDFMWRVATRHPTLSAGEGSLVVIGGQTLNIDPELDIWVESRAFAPHADKSYDGYWGFGQVPPHATPDNLSVTPLVRYDTVAAFNAQIARVTAGAVAASWQIKGLDTGSNALHWEWKLTNAVTGAMTASGTVTAVPAGEGDTVNIALGTRAAGSYLLWVRLLAGSQEYRWPSDWAAVTGLSTVPGSYQWTHPTLGLVQYDPYYNVGAKPYNSADPQQASLLALRAAAIAGGLTLKHAAWANFLVLFNSDGTAIESGGDYACLPVLVADGTDLDNFVAFGSVPVAATPGPALWTYDGSLATWMLDPRIRDVEAFWTDPDDLALWIGGMMAGRSGPMPFLLRYDVAGDADTTGDEETTPTSVATFICDCAQPSSKAINGIVKDQHGVLHAISRCDQFVLDPEQITGLRLVATHPGGRSLTRVSRADGVEVIVFACENDFVSSGLHAPAMAYCIELGRDHASQGVAKLLHSCMAAWHGRVWGLTETITDTEVPSGHLPFQQTTASRATNLQSLCYLEGTRWIVAGSWQVATFDASHVVQSGPLLLVLGMEYASREPRALRVTADGAGIRIEAGLTMDRHVWRAEPVPLSGSAAPSRQSALAVGPVADGGDATQIAGWYVAELPTPAAPPSGPSVPTGTTAEIFRYPGFNGDSSGIASAGEISSVIAADPVDYAMGAAIESAHPGLWLRVDAPDDTAFVGDDLTTVGNAALIATFNFNLPYGHQTMLPYPAHENVTMLVLMPPAGTVPNRTARIVLEPMS